MRALSIVVLLLAAATVAVADDPAVRSADDPSTREWTAKRYDMQLTSAMMKMDSVLWASEETPIDFSNYHELYANVMSLQPGMNSMMDEMRKIGGYVVAQEASM